MNSVTFENLPELPFAAAESINQLRVNLSLCGKEIKTVMVTSCEPNEGKSFICLNLVRSIAASGSRVLLIDCDLRNSTYRRKYNLCPGGARIPGTADVLAGRVGLQDVIYRTNIPHAYILPVTSTLPNPSFLLENGVLDQIIAQCREIYDYIIVDTPPALTVADALKIAPMCDGSMIVVRGGVTDRKGHGLPKDHYLYSGHGERRQPPCLRLAMRGAGGRTGVDRQTPSARTAVSGADEIPI